MQAIIAGAGALTVLFGYMVVKKVARSKCVVEKCSGCLSCESPAVQLAKKQTERLDDLYTIISKLKPSQVYLEDPPASPFEAENQPTKGEI